MSEQCSRDNSVGRVEFCWVNNGNRSVWSSEEAARRDADEQKQTGAQIQFRTVVISDWVDLA